MSHAETTTTLGLWACVMVMLIICWCLGWVIGHLHAYVEASPRKTRAAVSQTLAKIAVPSLSDPAYSAPYWKSIRTALHIGLEYAMAHAEDCADKYSGHYSAKREELANGAVDQINTALALVEDSKP